MNIYSRYLYLDHPRGFSIHKSWDAIWKTWCFHTIQCVSILYAYMGILHRSVFAVFMIRASLMVFSNMMHFAGLWLEVKGSWKARPVVSHSSPYERFAYMSHSCRYKKWVFLIIRKSSHYWHPGVGFQRFQKAFIKFIAVPQGLVRFQQSCMPQRCFARLHSQDAEEVAGWSGSFWCDSGEKDQFRGLGQAGFMACKRHLRARSEAKYRMTSDLQVISPKQIQQSSKPCLIVL